MARNSALPAIIRLRSMTDAAADDVFQGITYWTNDQLEEILDTTATQVLDAPLTAACRNETALWYTFDVPAHRMFDTAVEVRDSDNNLLVVDADYSLNIPLRRIIPLTATVPATVTLLVFDLNEAAAEVWQQKADHRASYIDHKAGGQTLYFEQEYRHCVERALFYRSKALRRWQIR